MSAAASGFELTYRVKSPTSADLYGHEIGRNLLYVNDINSAQQLRSEWVISKIVGQKVIVQPFRTKHYNEKRTLELSEINKYFKVRNRRVC